MAVASFKAAKVRLEIAAVLGLIAVAGVALFGPRAPLASGPIIVNTTADPGSARVCALRDAITAANTQVAVNGCAAGTGTDTITFSVSGTITLSSALPAIANASTGSLTIDGSGQTIAGAGAYQVLVVDSGATLTLNNLTIENGSSASGGGVYNGGTLTVTNTTFSDNSASLGGGGIYNGGTLTVPTRPFSANAAPAGGVDINKGATPPLSNSTQAKEDRGENSSGTIPSAT